MPAVLAWIDHDSKARERTLRILSLFQEKESRDELGLGSVRDSFADQLFPGTSTIQTRLRYMLFVPWIYHSLEEKRVPAKSFSIQADKLERDLVQPLMDSDDQAGVFGKTAGKRLKRLPSSVYWAGLGVWGIRITPFSQDEYHRRIDETYRRRDALKALEKDAKVRGDDIDVEQRMAVLSWHPRLPAPPEDFPGAVNFALSREEAEFIRDRIQVACPNSLLAFLALHCELADAQAPWEHPDYGSFSEQHKELLTHARLFSEVMHGAALSYNVQLARLRDHEGLVAKHQRETIYRWIYAAARLGDTVAAIHKITEELLRNGAERLNKRLRKCLYYQIPLKFLTRQSPVHLQLECTRGGLWRARCLMHMSGACGPLLCDPVMS